MLIAMAAFKGEQAVQVMQRPLCSKLNDYSSMVLGPKFVSSAAANTSHFNGTWVAICDNFHLTSYRVLAPGSYVHAVSLLLNFDGPFYFNSCTYKSS